MTSIRRRPWYLEPLTNVRGQHSPRLWRLWLALLVGVALAVAFEWALFGLLGGGWGWPHDQVRHLLGGQRDSSAVIQTGLALVTPVVAAMTVVFAYRRSKLSLAESHRADVAGFQQRFVDAARLLADESLVARIAGAIAMGSVARDWHANAQECLDVLTRSLRLRPLPEHADVDDEDSPTTVTWLGGEDVVRAALADQLALTLRYYDQHPHLEVALEVDLRGAWLAPDADFSSITFYGPVLLGGATVTGAINFAGSTATAGLDLTGASLLGVVTLRDMTVDELDASGVTALADVDAAGLRVEERLSLDHANVRAGFDVTGMRLPDDTTAEGLRLSHRWRDGAGAWVTRQPLGPLDAASAVPTPRGQVVEDDAVVRQVQWFVGSNSQVMGD